MSILQWPEREERGGGGREERSLRGPEETGLRGPEETGLGGPEETGLAGPEETLLRDRRETGSRDPEETSPRCGESKGPRDRAEAVLRDGAILNAAAQDGEDIMEALSRGSSTALDVLLDRHWTSLIAYAERFFPEADAAEDIVQEAFVRLWEGRVRWGRGSSAWAILLRITRNLCLNERRRDGVRQAWRTGSAEPAGPRTPEDEVQTDDLRRAVASAIEGLPPRRREVFVLARFHDLSYRQIAEATGTSPQTVANQMSRALAELRTALVGHLDGPWRSRRACAGPGLSIRE